MKKTLYIPKGQELRFENVSCERLIVAGSLIVDNAIKAKYVCGEGFINANYISARTVTADVIDAGTIITDKLMAGRVTAVEIRAVQSMAVSSYIRAGYVKSAKATFADAEIDDLDAGEVVKLAAKRRGLLGTLFASYVRAAWTALTFRNPEKAGTETGKDADAAESAPVTGQTAEAVSPDAAETLRLINDPEFLRLKAMYALANGSGYIWQLVPRPEPAGKAAAPAHRFAADEKTAA
ncbi:MAG: hypothetical protein LBL15_00380 [Oscillospiraceae bacterium]|jgi:hypothetical protein|nr:hypothetical protein [Oscillospiraceae bacterium]